MPHCIAQILVFMDLAHIHWCVRFMVDRTSNELIDPGRNVRTCERSDYALLALQSLSVTIEDHRAVGSVSKQLFDIGWVASKSWIKSQ